MTVLRRSTVVPRQSAVAARADAYLSTPGRLSISRETIASGALLALISVTLFGPLGVVAFIVATGVLLATRPLDSLRDIGRNAPLLALPLLAMLSTLWSSSPPLSMRAGLQLLLTFVAVIVVCRNLRLERMILLLFVGFTAISLTTLPGIPRSIASGMPLWSASLGSKNQVGFAGYMMTSLALAVMFDRRQPWVPRVIALPAVPLGGVIVYLSQSGGSTTSMIVTLLVFPPLALLGLFKLHARIALAAIAVALVGIAVVFQADIVAAIDSFRTSVLNKDATLTGRTYLWDFAERVIAQHPVLGTGYGAFWRQGNVDAEGLWRWAGIGNRMGFNFHNALVGMRVDLGMAGAVLLLATAGAIAVAATLRQLFQPTVAMAGMLGILAVTYIRSYVEEGLVAPFSLVTLMWLAVGLYGWAPRVAEEQDTPGVVSDRSTGLSTSDRRRDGGPKRRLPAWLGPVKSDALSRRPRTG